MTTLLYIVLSYLLYRISLWTQRSWSQHNFSHPKRLIAILYNALIFCSHLIFFKTGVFLFIHGIEYLVAIWFTLFFMFVHLFTGPTNHQKKRRYSSGILSALSPAPVIITAYPSRPHEKVRFLLRQYFDIAGLVFVPSATVAVMLDRYYPHNRALWFLLGGGLFILVMSISIFALHRYYRKYGTPV